MNQVQIEHTPNPATMKFSFSEPVSDESFECTSAQDTDRSPLAAKIFGFPWASSVFVGPDFITVTKQDWVEWAYLAEPLAGLIQEHVNNGEAVVEKNPARAEAFNQDNSPVAQKIREILDREIRPAVAMDGGDIVFSRYEDQVVYVHMKGACSGCPSSTATLKQGIEVRLRQAIPEIREVVAI